MTTTVKRVSVAVLAATLVVAVSGCSNWSKRDRNTAIGAGAGAIGGSTAVAWAPWAARRWAVLSAIKSTVNFLQATQQTLFCPGHAAWPAFINRPPA